MVLFSIIGELGSGKTVTLTYLAWSNWFKKRAKIYSNYHLYKIPYIYIKGVNQMTQMSEGYCVFDEMWTIIDSRASGTKRNKLVSDILLRSRKRELVYIFTTQLLDLLDKRIRKILDFTSYPILNRTETICKVLVFKGGYPKSNMMLRQFMFKTPVVFEMFNTREEIDMEEECNEEPKIIFQESKDKEPMFFDTWEKADKYAEMYWWRNRYLLEYIK